VPRYLVERDFPTDFGSFLASNPMNSIIGSNEDSGVTWLYSYVTDDQRRSYCLVEAASPEAIRRAARRAGLPAGIIRRVSVLQPYAYPADAVGA
jgi:hypothetical protein